MAKLEKVRQITDTLENLGCDVQLNEVSIRLGVNEHKTPYPETVMTSGKLENLGQIAEALEEMGYEIHLHEDAIHTKVGGRSNPFMAVLTINENNELVITCKVAKLGDYDEDKVPELQFALLDANTQIRPYAFGIISGVDNPEMEDVEEFPIVLTDSLPLGDFCGEELQSSMDSLLMAIESSSDELRIGLKK